MVRDYDYRILLTGANGQLGRELVSALEPHGRIVPCVRKPMFDALLENAEVVDFANLEDVRNLVREIRPNLIVNAAAYADVDAAERDIATAFAVNGIAPRVLAEEAARIDATLVHYSTDYVFSGTGSTAWREEDRPAPVNVYGRTKLAGERAIQKSGVRHLIVRTSWLYGVHGNNFVEKMVNLSAAQRGLRVVDDQIGSPTSARFVAEVTAESVNRAKDSSLSLFGGGVIHAVCAGETSWYEFAKEIFQQAREFALPIKGPAIRAVPSTAYETVAKRPRNCRLNTARLQENWDSLIPDWKSELRRNLVAICRRCAATAKESRRGERLAVNEESRATKSAAF